MMVVTDDKAAKPATTVQVFIQVLVSVTPLDTFQPGLFRQKADFFSHGKSRHLQPCLCLTTQDNGKFSCSVCGEQKSFHMNIIFS